MQSFLDKAIKGSVFVWSAVTCHRFGPWRLAAPFRQRGALRNACCDMSQRPKPREVVALQIETLVDKGGSSGLVFVSDILMR